jgi:hypothetical protein
MDLSFACISSAILGLLRNTRPLKFFTGRNGRTLGLESAESMANVN